MTRVLYVLEMIVLKARSELNMAKQCLVRSKRLIDLFEGKFKVWIEPTFVHGIGILNVQHDLTHNLAKHLQSSILK